MAEASFNSNAVLDNCFSVFTDDEQTSIERAIQCIDGLRNQSFQSPNRFSIRGRFTNEMADALHRAFGDFAARGIHWKRLNVYFRRDSEVEPRLLGEALGIANQGSLFQVIDIQTLGLEGEIMNGHETDADILPSGLQMLSSLAANKRLESLHLSRLVLSPEDSDSLSLALRTSTMLHTFTFACAISQQTNQQLGDAIAANKSLKVAFIYERNEVTSRLMRSMVGHPALEDLRVISKVNSDLPVVLSQILSDSACRLKTLAVFMDNSRAPTSIIPLLEGIQKNSSLTFLASWFHFPGERPFTNFLQTWKSHPRLQRVQFWERFQIEDMLEAKQGTRFPRRIEINYVEPEGARRPRDDSYEAAVKQFLDGHPEICWTNDDLHSQATQFASCLNHSGRYLMNREIPHGLWSLVLERIQKSSFRADRELCGELSFPAEHKASTVYELLHGQAFAGRANSNVSSSGKKRRWEDI